MGVCAIQHRIITGKHNSKFLFLCQTVNGKTASLSGILKRIVVRFLNSEADDSGVFAIFSFIILYMYILLLLMALLMNISINCTGTYSPAPGIISATILNTKRRDMLNGCFLIIFMYIIKSKSRVLRNSSIFANIAAQYTLWVAMLNFILIVISNPTIINPGPRPKNPKISVLYQNVRGFIPPLELPEKNPSLNVTKIAGFQTYVFDKKPDIVILNESWLKKVSAMEKFCLRTHINFLG